MKHVMILALAAAHLFTAPAVQAATLENVPQVGRDVQFRAGTFAGGRIRLAMGGQKKATKLRAGLTLAAMQSGRSGQGASFTRFGEGLEFGYTSTDRFGISMAGYNLTAHRLGAAEGEEEDGKRKGLSTPAIIGIAVGGVALLTVAAFVAICIDDTGECGSD